MLIFRALWPKIFAPNTFSGQKSELRTSSPSETFSDNSSGLYLDDLLTSDWQCFATIVIETQLDRIKFLVVYLSQPSRKKT